MHFKIVENCANFLQHFSFFTNIKSKRLQCKICCTSVAQKKARTYIPRDPITIFETLGVALNSNVWLLSASSPTVCWFSSIAECSHGSRVDTWVFFDEEQAAVYFYFQCKVHSESLWTEPNTAVPIFPFGLSRSSVEWVERGFEISMWKRHLHSVFFLIFAPFFLLFVLFLHIGASSLWVLVSPIATKSSVEQPTVWVIASSVIMIRTSQSLRNKCCKSIVSNSLYTQSWRQQSWCQQSWFQQSWCQQSWRKQRRW